MRLAWPGLFPIVMHHPA